MIHTSYMRVGRAGKKRSGQTLIEYALVLSVMIIPFAVALHQLVATDGDGSTGLAQPAFRAAFGNGVDSPGVVARPYP